MSETRRAKAHRFGAALLCALLLCAALGGCGKSISHDASTAGGDVQTINSIYIWHSAFGQRYPEYEVDLAGGEWWYFVPGDTGGAFVPRDETAENAGYAYGGAFNAEAAGVFLLACQQHRLLRWKDSYVDESIYDGHQWGITLRFSGGGEKTVTGSNAYPDTYDQIADALKELTGQQLL